MCGRCVWWGNFVVNVCKMRLGGIEGEGGIQSSRKGWGMFPFLRNADLGGCVRWGFV